MTTLTIVTCSVLLLIGWRLRKKQRIERAHETLRAEHGQDWQ